MKAPEQEIDEQLLIEAAQQDPRRFADLYERYFYRVYAYVIRRVRNREAAEDITAQVFHQALAGLAKYEWRGKPFSAWLMRIAANALADHWKLAARTEAEPLSEDAAETVSESPDIENRATLFQLVESLPADQRRVVLARFVDEKSIQEIAQEFGRTEGAIKQLQFRALQKLRAQIGGTGG